MEIDKNEAVTKAHILMETVGTKLSPLAYDYLHHMYYTCGATSEVALTAFAHYNQVVEGLSCEDEAYKIDSAGAAWFFKNKAFELPKQSQNEIAAQNYLHSVSGINGRPTGYADEDFMEGIKWKEKSLIEFIEMIQSCPISWSKDSKDGYLLACQTIKNKLLE